jgi:hypothetical protein
MIFDRRTLEGLGNLYNSSVLAPSQKTDEAMVDQKFERIEED